jgi:hypothetical protein
VLWHLDVKAERWRCVAEVRSRVFAKDAQHVVVLLLPDRQLCKVVFRFFLRVAAHLYLCADMDRVAQFAGRDRDVAVVGFAVELAGFG